MMSEHAEACVEGDGVGNGPVPDENRRNQLIKMVAAGLPAMNRRKVAMCINTMLMEQGFPTLSEGSIYRIIHYGVNTATIKADGVVRPRQRLSARKRKDQQRQQASNTIRNSIRRSNEVNQYESMMNAPAGKLNNPLIRTAEAVQHALVELSALDPAVAVTQIPIERCRQWTPEFAEWWATFTQLCEERRLRETPDVPPMPYPRRTKLDPNPDVPTDEYQLSATQATVLAWLRTQTAPATQTSIVVHTKVPEGSAYSALTRLCALGMVTADTTRQPYTYVVATPIQ